MKTNCIESRLSNLYYHYAKIVDKWPLVFLILPTLLTISLSLGCMWRLRILKDKIELYTPTDGPAVAERDTLQHLFRIDDSNPFYSQRRYEADRTGFLIVTAVQPNGSILNFESFDEMVHLWHRIKGLMVHQGIEWHAYEDLCIKIPVDNTDERVCAQNFLLKAYKENPLIIQGLNLGRNSSVDQLQNFLGGVEKDPTNGRVVFAKATIIPYELKHSRPSYEERAVLWERKLTDFLKKYKSQLITVYWWTSETLSDETHEERSTILKLIGPLVALVSCFTILSCFVGSFVRSKPWLGVGGVISASGAIISTIGLLGYMGQQFTSVAYFMPFIIFSIGVDNVFILVAAWQKTSTKLPVSERLGQVFRDAGVSITVTSLTDGLSFGVGCQMSFPSVRIFCLYASVAICFVFLYQLTFFAGLMVLSGRREAAGRNCLTCFSNSIMDSSTKLADSKVTEPSSDEKSMEVQDDGVRSHVIARFFRDKFSAFITHPITQGCVIAVFILYLGVAAWGCTRLKIGLKPTDLLPSKSQAYKALMYQSELFSTNGPTLYVTFPSLANELNYELPHYWHAIERAVNRFENTRYTKYADSWLRIFLIFAKTHRLKLSAENFIPLLEKSFLQNSLYAKYREDVKINDIGTRLVASRIAIKMEHCGLPNQTSAISYVRDIAETSPLNTSVYASFFLFADQQDAILRNLLINVGIASAAVIAVSLLMIPKPICSIWVCLAIVSINLGILGYMPFWGVKLDFVSMVTIVMSVGFCVDFSAHIAYHFAKGDGLSANDRIRQALYCVGTPILQSAASTLIGMSLLIRVDSYIYQSFMKTVMLVIILGAFHGLFILPVLLTIFYCKKCGHGRRNSAVDKYSGSPERTPGATNSSNNSSTGDAAPLESNGLATAQKIPTGGCSPEISILPSNYGAGGAPNMAAHPHGYGVVAYGNPRQHLWTHFWPENIYNEPFQPNVCHPVRLPVLRGMPVMTSSSSNEPDLSQRHQNFKEFNNDYNNSRGLGLL